VVSRISMVTSGGEKHHRETDREAGWLPVKSPVVQIGYLTTLKRNGVQ
jgi:hypothetical protein